MKAKQEKEIVGELITLIDGTNGSNGDYEYEEVTNRKAIAHQSKIVLAERNLVPARITA